MSDISGGLPPESDKSDKGDKMYEQGNRVKLDVPVNPCIDGQCTGIVVKSTDPDFLDELCVFWQTACLRHKDNAGTESDPIRTISDIISEM